MLDDSAMTRSTGASESEPLNVICVEDNADILRLIELALAAEPSVNCIRTFDNVDHMLHVLESGEAAVGRCNR
jgi:hypothetical protein